MERPRVFAVFEGGGEDRVVCCEGGAAALATVRGFEPPGRRIDLAVVRD